ncbi:DNA-binding transcriptional ArsR family regulator [Anaerosolibacter carboniphilus]|uniref:DNA-binding transcriptional ArsR family regulator n=1 Tax=Anaerosolibacter carboniphilus TaxID=1417629 RepID=A0A841KPX6_9FIRM|nr:metalloregulator ArsR/SmtB family transcription factor [Anaerosolibacter carboniphilus]MBB6215526.1 DNA-binding transcriptional ArsR family regulator [Anaerosolibacter carboniphilus]
MDGQKMAKIFKALSNQNRLELYLKIVETSDAGYSNNNECLISDIIHCLNIGAPTISHHIKELANAGLITTEKKGKFLICRANQELAEEVSKLFKL